MATVTPYLFFDGTCADALSYYAGIFGGDVQIQTFADAPMDIPEEQKGHVMHGSLSGGSLTLMASDGMKPGERIKESNTVSLSVAPDTVEQGKQFFDALSQGGQVLMSYEKQFWGDTFGHVIDKFGIQWMINAS